MAGEQLTPPAIYKEDSPLEDVPFDSPQAHTPPRSSTTLKKSLIQAKKSMLEVKNASSKLLVKAVVAAACTGSFLFGFNLSLLNTSMATIGGEFKWCDYEGYTGCNDFKLKAAFVSTGVFVGAAIGSLVAGRLLKYGCLTVFNIALGVMMLGIILSCASPNFTILLIARLIVGIGVGIISVEVPTYISEITPPSSRGSFGVLHQLLITIGIFIGVLLGLAFNLPPENEDEQLLWEMPKFDKIWWRVMLGFGAIPTVIAYLLFAYIYNFETPYHLINIEKYEEAKAVLRKLTDKEDVDDDYLAITESIEKAKEAKESGLSFMNIMSNSTFRYILIVGCLISAFQQFTGINVFITNSNKLFESAGLARNLVTIMSIVLTFINVLMTFPAIYLIEKLGRRTLLLIGVAGMGVSVVPGMIMLWVNEESKATSWVAIAGAISFICFFSSTYGPVLWVYLFEIYPVEIKDVAAGGAVACNWIAGIVMVFAASWLETDIAYTLFIGFCAVGFALIFLTMKESKGFVVGESPYIPKKVAPSTSTSARTATAV